MGIKFKLEFNLQQITLIRVAVHIWKSHLMITKISYFVTRKITKLELITHNLFRVKIKDWLSDIFEQVDIMKLPDAIKNDLLYVMRPVGENLLDYLVRTSVKWDGLLEDESFPELDVYCKHIEFDYFGEVDEVKTFLNIYNAHEGVSIPFLFYEACTYCLEDVIHSIWNKCSEQVKHNLKVGLSVGREKDWQFIPEYWIHRISRNQSIIPCESIDIYTLSYCAQKANNVGLKYFINKPSQDDENKIILRLAERILFKDRDIRNRHNIYHDSEFENPKKLHTYKLINSLLPHITEDKKNEFFISNKKKIILLLLKEWPWKYLLLDFDYFDKETHDWLIEIIIKTIVNDYNFYKKIVYTDLWLISKIWKKNPNPLKESIVEFCWSMKVRTLYKLHAVILVTSVIDDTDGINKLRPKICKGFEKYCNKLIKEQKYELVDLYLKNVLQNDKERKAYKELLRTKYICRRLLLFTQLEDFDIFLNWRFDNDHAQITQFKKYFTVDTVIIKILCRMLDVYTIRFEKPIGSLFCFLGLDRSYQEQLKQKLIKNIDFKAHLRKWIEEDPKRFNYVLTFFQFSSKEIDEIEKTFRYLHSNTLPQ